MSKNVTQNRTKQFIVRLTEREHERIKQYAIEAGSSSIAEYVRDKALKRIKKRVTIK